MNIVSGSVVYDANSDEYEVLEFLGNGSFGGVYKLKKKDGGTILALKTLLASFADEKSMKAFINEGNLALSVKGSHVIEYYYFHDGQKFSNLSPYIIMEYADGGTLDNIIKTRMTTRSLFTNDEIKQYILELIDGMESINKHLIHRDIKPDNILVSNNLLKISDFGLGKIVEERTRTFTFKGFGCLPYLAPEGWKFETNTIQMDIYSMGIVFYEICTLRHPLDVMSGKVDDWRSAHLFQKPKDPSHFNSRLSPIVNQLIMKMIEKSTTKRFKSWEEIKEWIKKEEIPTTKNSSIVNSMLQQQLARDSQLQEERLKKEKRQAEIEESKKLIELQFRDDIVGPLKDLVDEFNFKYAGNKIQLLDRSLGIGLRSPSGKAIDISLRQIIEEDFHRKVTFNDFGRSLSRSELRVPKLYNRTLMAWGVIKSSDGRGYNIVLVENAGDMYGTWYMFVNYNNIIFENRRPEPFPFDFNEIEEEMQHFNATHIYRTEVKSLDIDLIKSFLSQYIM